MNHNGSSCPYCGLEKIENKGPKCRFCEMAVGDEYIMYINADNEIVNLCSIECMDLLEESMKQEEE